MGSASMIGIFILLVVVALPLILGTLLIVKSRSGGKSYPACGACGYNVAGTVGTATRCPECGGDFLTVGIVPPRGRRNPAMLWIGIVLLAIPLTCGGFLTLTATQAASRARQAAIAARQQALAAQQAAATQPQQSDADAEESAPSDAPSESRPADESQ